MSVFGNASTESVAAALEKCVAKIDDSALCTMLAEGLDVMPPGDRSALTTSIFSAFRERGESSEDAVEGAGTSLLAVEAGDLAAQRALLTYAGSNTGLLKEVLVVLALDHDSALGSLPQTLVDATAARLSA